MITTSLRQWLLLLLAAVVTLGLGLGVYLLSETVGLRAQTEAGSRQLELHARAVESELDKYTYLPALLELERSAGQLLAAPDSICAASVNAYLEGLQQRSGSRAIFLMNLHGKVLASSNWRDADSFVGEDLAFRPYFKEAAQGRPGRYYGVGSTTGEAGYFLAHGLRFGGQLAGVAVVKVRLDALEARWQRARLEAFVSDENGIIILSSDAIRRLKSIAPLDAASRERLARSLQYYAAPLSEWQPLEREPLGDGVARLTLARENGEGPQRPARYLAQSLPITDTPWHMTLLTPLKDQRREAIIQGALAAVAFALLAIVLIARNERRKVIATRKAQDELVRTEKLTAIGQMSTSIAHELNQPLAALRTLSGNTARFLERGQLQVASTNLRTINDLVERMARIISSLRAFARGGEQGGHAQVNTAVDAALGVLAHRLQGWPGALERNTRPATVAIDHTRLELILINLLGNALDALQGVAAPNVVVHGEAEGDHYCLQVRDNGPGVHKASRDQLFEPFFTTKPGEHGLGLGLTLSAQLAAAAGGRLSLDARAPTGATFILTLPLSAPRAGSESA